MKQNRSARRNRRNGNAQSKNISQNVANASRRVKAKKKRGINFVPIGQTLGSIAGSFAPGIGGTLGGIIGSGLGKLGNMITGSGDYNIKENVLVRPGPVPSFGPSSIRIQHKEYLGDLLGSTNFTLSSYAINPGMQASFPWLSSLASNFEQYHFNGLVFQFVSTSADALNSTNTALGKLIMATDYNALDASFINASQMLITLYSNYGKPA